MRNHLLIWIGIALFWPTFLSAQNVKVISLDLGPDQPKDSLNHWKARQRGLPPLVRFHQVDVMAIQGAQAHHLEFAKNELREYAALKPKMEHPLPAEHTALLYRKERFAPEQSGLFWLSLTPDEPSKGWDARQKVTCTYALLFDRMTESRFWVLATRLDAEGGKARAESLKLILSKIDAFNAGPDRYPVMVLGNLQCAPGDNSLLPFNEQMVDAGQLGEFACYGPQGTYNNYQIEQSPGFDQKRDYVYCSRQGWVVERCAVLTDTYRGRPLSDHYPLFVEFRQIAAAY